MNALPLVILCILKLPKSHIRIIGGLKLENLWFGQLKLHMYIKSMAKVDNQKKVTQKKSLSGEI